MARFTFRAPTHHRAAPRPTMSCRRRRRQSRSSDYHKSVAKIRIMRDTAAINCKKFADGARYLTYLINRWPNIKCQSALQIAGGEAGRWRR